MKIGRILYAEATKKTKEYESLIHELNKIDQRIVRTADYIMDMNAFLISEGTEPVEFSPTPNGGKE